jgi:hypothetical protein
MPSNQFLTYLGAIPTMDNLQYWFEGVKITGNTDAEKLTALKTKFQEVFRKTNSAGDNIVFEKIWNSPNGLPQTLFPNLNKADAANEFVRLVNTVDNSLFKFLKIK